MRPALEDWQQLNACRRGLVSSFLRHYRAAGYREAAPLSVTSKQDESVVFVGAAISALKKDYIYPGKLPAGGLVIAQDAVRTRNVKNMLADDLILPISIPFFPMSLRMRPLRRLWPSFPTR